MIKNNEQKQTAGQTAETKTLEQFLNYGESKKLKEPVNKSLFVYRLAYAPSTETALRHKTAYEYLKAVITAINKTDSDSRNQKDEHYFYFTLVSDLDEQSKKNFEEYLKKKNFTLKKEKNRVYNKTINLKNLLSYKQYLDKKFNVKYDINEAINNK